MDMTGLKISEGDEKAHEAAETVTNELLQTKKKSNRSKSSQQSAEQDAAHQLQVPKPMLDDSNEASSPKTRESSKSRKAPEQGFQRRSFRKKEPYDKTQRKGSIRRKKV